MNTRICRNLAVFGLGAFTALGIVAITIARDTRDHPKLEPNITVNGQPLQYTVNSDLPINGTTVPVIYPSDDKVPVVYGILIEAIGMKDDKKKKPFDIKKTIFEGKRVSTKDNVIEWNMTIPGSSFPDPDKTYTLLLVRWDFLVTQTVDITEKKP